MLIDEQAATVWTGRSPRTLRRWAHDRRIHRYGTYHQPMYDLHELPERTTRRVPPRPVDDPHDVTT
jgi:hypothetical protein